MIPTASPLFLEVAVVEAHRWCTVSFVATYLDSLASPSVAFWDKEYMFEFLNSSKLTTSKVRSVVNVEL